MKMPAQRAVARQCARRTAVTRSALARENLDACRAGRAPHTKKQTLGQACTAQRALGQPARYLTICLNMCRSTVTTACSSGPIVAGGARVACRSFHRQPAASVQSRKPGFGITALVCMCMRAPDMPCSKGCSALLTQPMPPSPAPPASPGRFAVTSFFPYDRNYTVPPSEIVWRTRRTRRQRNLKLVRPVPGALGL